MLRRKFLIREASAASASASEFPSSSSPPQKVKGVLLRIATNNTANYTTTTTTATKFLPPWTQQQLQLSRNNIIYYNTFTSANSSSLSMSKNQTMNGTSGRGRGRAGRGRGGGGRGRGRGRGRGGRGTSSGERGSYKQGHGSSVSTNNKTRPPRPLKIYTSDFQSVFHAQVSQAAKYKVYMPQSSASSKYLKLKQQFVEYQQFNQKKQKQTTTSAEEEGDDDESAIITKQLDELTLQDPKVKVEGLSTTSITTTTSSPDDEDGDLFDNLVVIPDTKSPQAIYVCQDTNFELFRRKKGIDCEQKLAREIFGDSYDSASTQDKVVHASGSASTDNHGSNTDGIVIPFKVSCAQCLLTGHYPNGFVAIVSSSTDKLQPTLDRARTCAEKKRRRNLYHSDHSDFVSAVQISTINILMESIKTRNKNHQISNEILDQLSEGGVDDLSPSGSSADNEGIRIQIKLGHHLQALLYNISKKQHTEYVLVLGYKDSPTQIELDLPGGKRHLGETSVEGAIRETEEEISLLIDPQWFKNQISTKYGGTRRSKEEEKDNEKGTSSQIQVLSSKRKDEQGNVYFVMTPPPLPQVTSLDENKKTLNEE